MEEFRIVNYQETFNDVAMREIADVKAACLCRLQFGRCKRSDCRQCSARAQYNHCYDTMNDYDRLRLSKYISEAYVQKSRNPNAWRTHKSFLKHYFATVIVLSLSVIGFMFAIMLFFGDPMDRPPSTYNEKIVSTIKRTQSSVYDYNKDGLINCIDHAVLFKLLWDKRYPTLKDDCEIVRNYNIYTGMNHLFCAVKVNGVRRFVEPYTDNPYIWDIPTIWGKTFDVRYNRYGETQKWVNTRR